MFIFSQSPQERRTPGRGGKGGSCAGWQICSPERSGGSKCPALGTVGCGDCCQLEGIMQEDLCVIAYVHMCTCVCA